MNLLFKKRRVGRSADEWCKIADAHLGWTCTIDGVTYSINGNWIFTVDQPCEAGCPRKCISFREYCKKALKEDAEWKLEAWEKSLKPSGVAVETANEVKSTSEVSKSISSPGVLIQERVESIQVEVQENGMSNSRLTVFSTRYSVSEGSLVGFSDLPPGTSRRRRSHGTQSGSMDIPSLPSLDGTSFLNASPEQED